MHTAARSLIAGLAALTSTACPAGAAWDTYTIDCTLSPASILVAQDGAVKPDSSPGKDMVLTFTGFDEKAGKAMLVGNLGSVPVLFDDVGGNLQIVQITDTANVTTTTITVEGEQIWAVHSRHMWIQRAGVLSVYEGPCRLR